MPIDLTNPVNFTNHFMVSLAYKAVVAQLMLAEANFFVDRLDLPESRPLQAANAGVVVSPPLLAGLGRIETASFLYSFPGDGRFTQLTNDNGTTFPVPERGKLAYVVRKEPFKKYAATFEDTYEPLSKLPCLIDTNSAYQLATQWLAAVSVDVAALERKHKPLSVQQFYLDPPMSLEAYVELRRTGQPIPAPHVKKPRPIFDVTWGGTADDTPAVWVEIFGVTKELIHLRMEDTSFLKRPPIVITNALELNAQPTPPTKQLQTPTNGVPPPDKVQR